MLFKKTLRTITVVSTMTSVVAVIGQRRSGNRHTKVTCCHSHHHVDRAKSGTGSANVYHHFPVPFNRLSPTSRRSSGGVCLIIPAPVQQTGCALPSCAQVRTPALDPEKSKEESSAAPSRLPPRMSPVGLRYLLRTDNLRQPDSTTVW